MYDKEEDVWRSGNKKMGRRKEKEREEGEKCKEGNEIIALSNTATEKEEKKRPQAN